PDPVSPPRSRPDSPARTQAGLARGRGRPTEGLAWEVGGEVSLPTQFSCPPSIPCGWDSCSRPALLLSKCRSSAPTINQLAVRERNLQLLQKVCQRRSGFVQESLPSPQGFSKVGACSGCSRLRRSKGEEGAGCGRSPQPAPSSPERLACEPFWMKRQLLRSTGPVQCSRFRAISLIMV